MSQFDFDYELIFTNDFDSNIISQSDVPDKSHSFQNAVNDEIQKIKTVLGLHGGVHKLSTFLDYDSLKYKITLEKLSL